MFRTANAPEIIIDKLKKNIKTSNSIFIVPD